MAKKTPHGLGKGLSALLGDGADVANFRKPVEYINKTIVTNQQAESSADIMIIPIEMIEPNPFQPRTSFDETALQELADSITSLGIIQPITVRKRAAGLYQIISGERRFRASKLAGLTSMPAYIKETNDTGMLEMAIVENIQREDLDPIEVALSFQRLIDECDLTQDQMAERVGKKRTSVTNYLRLLKLPAKIQHDVKVGLLSVGHAKVLLGVEDVKIQELLCDLVIKNEWTVRQLEDEIRRIALEHKEKKITKTTPQDLPEGYIKVLDIMGKYFSGDISLRRNKAGKGTMTITFNDDTDINNFLNILEK